MYKLKLQFDLNVPITDDPTARSKATALIAAIKKLIEQDCNTPRPTIEKVVLANQNRRDGFNILGAMNAELAGK